MLPTEYLLYLFGTYGKELIAYANAYHLIRIPLSPEARTMGARNRKAVWELTERGETVLAKHGRHRLLERESDQFQHKYLRAIIQFSFDRIEQVPGLEKRTIHDILLDERCPDATRALPKPSWIHLKDYVIKPDADLFGYAYTQASGKKRYVYLHGFEADRGTEPLTGYDRQTITLKIKKYTEYLNGGYRARYGLKNCAVPILTTKADRARNILDLIEKEAGTQAHKFLVKVIPPFGEPCPPPTAHLITGDWMQCGGKTLNLMDILKGEDDGQRQESGARERASA